MILVYLVPSAVLVVIHIDIHIHWCWHCIAFFHPIGFQQFFSLYICIYFLKCIWIFPLLCCICISKTILASPNNFNIHFPFYRLHGLSFIFFIAYYYNHDIYVNSTEIYDFLFYKINMDSPLADAILLWVTLTITNNKVFVPIHIYLFWSYNSAIFNLSFSLQYFLILILKQLYSIHSFIEFHIIFASYHILFWEVYSMCITWCIS